MNSAKTAARALTGSALTALRDRFGRRNVNLTPEFMGFGNQLYLWVWAHAHRNDPVPPKVTLTKKMPYWADLVPTFARRYLIERADVSFWDQRNDYWAYPEREGDPRGFTDTTRAAFIGEALLPEPLLAGAGTGPLAEDGVLVVNVRRGDYYSNAGHRAEFGIDVEGYLKAAIAGSIDIDGEIRRLHLISDDIGWCRGLDWLASYAAQVSFANPADPPASNLRDVASARRLVITNSTFSIWAAAIADHLHANQASVWAPAFFQRRYGPGRCYEYDAHWHFVDVLPGGWQPDWVLAGHETSPR